MNRKNLKKYLKNKATKTITKTLLLKPIFIHFFAKMKKKN